MSHIFEFLGNICISDLITLAVSALVLFSFIKSVYSLYLRKKLKKSGIDFRKNSDIKERKDPKDYEPIVPIYAEYYRPNGVMYRMHRRLRRNRS